MKHYIAMLIFPTLFVVSSCATPTHEARAETAPVSTTPAILQYPGMQMNLSAYGFHAQGSVHTGMPKGIQG